MRASDVCRIARVERSDRAGERQTGPCLADQHAFAASHGIRASVTDSGGELIVRSVVHVQVVDYDDHDEDHHDDDNSGAATGDDHNDPEAAANDYNDDHDHEAVRSDLLLIRL